MSIMWAAENHPGIKADRIREVLSSEDKAITVSDTIDMGIKGKYCGTVLLLPEAFKTPKIVKCHYTKHKYISVFQVMPITKELLSEKLRKGTNGIYWLMEYFYTHDDDYKLVSSKPYAAL